MKTQDLKKKSEKDLLKIIMEGKQKLQDGSFNMSGTTTKDSYQRRKIRKNIARVLTILNSPVSQDLNDKNKK